MSTQQIWQDYRGNLLAFIQRRIRDPSMADDVLQDVFVKIHSRIESIRDDTKVESWIYQITRNAIVDFYRSQHRTETLPESLSSGEADMSASSREEIKSWLVPLIRNLPAPYREALMLSEIGGLTQKDVAERQGLSLSGAKSRIQRGRAMLKNVLIQCCRFEFDSQGRVVDYEARRARCRQC